MHEIKEILIEMSQNGKAGDIAVIIDRLAHKEDELLTAAEVADYLKISERQLKGKYSFWRKHSFTLHNDQTIRIRRKHLTDYINQKEIKAAREKRPINKPSNII